MPKLYFIIEHNEKIHKVKEKIDELISEKLSDYSEKVNHINQEWVDYQLRFSGKAQGFTIKGNLNIDEKEIHISASFPFVAIPFKSKIEEYITNEIKYKLA